MGFVVGVVAALLVIFLLTYITFKKPVFGRILIALSLGLVLTSTFLYFQKDKRVEKQQKLISVDEIIISDVKFNYAYGSFYKLSGTIANKSTRYRLQSVNFKLSFYQCADENSQLQDCELTKEISNRVKTRLAAQQSASFESYLLLEKEDYSSLRLKVEVISGIGR